jgi:transcription termination factor Rho
MAVLDRSDLEASSLADLHAIAGQLGLDGYRRLRKEELIERILDRSGGEAPRQDAGTEAETAPSTRRRRSPRRRRSADEETDVEEPARARGRRRSADEQSEAEEPARARGGRRTRRPAARREAQGAADEEAKADERAVEADERVVEGVVELLANGSAFLTPDESFDLNEDVYVSAAQVRRCELEGGDRVGGPLRAARGSERHPSLVRVDTINGEPADAVMSKPKFDGLPAAFPSERFVLGSEDPTLKAIEWLTPIGRGSRVAIVGAAYSGKTETLRRLLGALAGEQDLQVELLLTGVRPEETGDWEQGPHKPVATVTLAAGPEAQGRALDKAVDACRRRAARGEHVLLAVDGLDGVPPHVARRALAAARNVLDGGSLTVIATARQPFGGETTVIALDALLASTGRLPALNLLASGTLKAELLVGEESAAEIVKARAKAAGAIG